MPTRRQVLAQAASAVGLLFGAAARGGSEDAEDRPGQRLRPWRPGTLDIHHIATGRGDSTLIVAPSGAMALIDAGAVAGADPARVAARPDSSRNAGAWIARYAARRMAETGAGGLSALVVTHLHADHVGGVDPGAGGAGSADFTPTGVSAVAQAIPVDRILDPRWPDYGTDHEDPATARNYIAFVRAFAAGGGRVERLEVGSTAQILAGEPGLEVRTVAAEGRVWTGERAIELFPPATLLPPPERPRENDRSALFHLRFGRFSWFGGGDATDWADAGTRPWLNALTPAAQAVGPVDVATLTHHGMFDAGSAETIRALAARHWVIPAWHALHPGPDVLVRILSERLFPGAREVHATALHPWTEGMMPWLTRRLAGPPGHVVVRVASGGETFRVVVTDNRDEADRVLYATATVEAQTATARTAVSA